ncbi:MAG: hypothetical protein WC441_04800 [Patescibacteria group bacterium]
MNGNTGNTEKFNGHFTEGERAYIELAADRAAYKAIENAKTEWSKDIRLHKAECDVGKFKTGFGLICSIIGGVVVVVANTVVRIIWVSK